MSKNACGCFVNAVINFIWAAVNLACARRAKWKRLLWTYICGGCETKSSNAFRRVSARPVHYSSGYVECIIRSTPNSFDTHSGHRPSYQHWNKLPLSAPYHLHLRELFIHFESFFLLLSRRFLGFPNNFIHLCTSRRCVCVCVGRMSVVHCAVPFYRFFV